MGYLSSLSPHIRSGAVSALSVLVHNDVNLCLSVPDLLPSVLELMHSNAIEVIKVTVILEIMVRKYGSAAVKLLVPDKYKTYFKEVLENHRGKSRESNNADTEPDPSESSLRGQQKRKHDDSYNASKIEYFVERRRHKIEGKLKGNDNNTDERRSHADSSGGTAPLSGKRKIERKNANMRGEAQRHRSIGAKNSSKHNLVA